MPLLSAQCVHQVGWPRLLLSNQIRGLNLFRRSARCLPVDVDLPAVVFERLVIVPTFRLNIWQYVTILDFVLIAADEALIPQFALAVGNLRLRLHLIHLQERLQVWQDESSDQPTHPAFSSDPPEMSIGVVHKVLRKCRALRSVRIQHFRRRLALRGSGELPRQIFCIAKPSVHALSANRAAEMCRIAADKYTSADLEAFGDTVVHRVGGEPARLFDIELGAFFHCVSDICESDIVIVHIFLWHNASDTGEAIAVERNVKAEAQWSSLASLG